MASLYPISIHSHDPPHVPMVPICMQATVAKYLDTSEFVLGRVQRQARAGKM